MARQILPILALLTSTAFLLVGNGLQSILLPIRGVDEGFTTFEIGFIGTGWAVGFVLGCLVVPRIVRRVGHIRAFAAAAAAAAIVALLNGLVVFPLAWVALRVASGFFIAGTFMIIESWLNERATNETRGTIFALYMTITYAALMAGQFLVATADPDAATLFMVSAIFFCLALMPTALSTAQSPQPLATVKLDLMKLYANSPVAFITVTLVGFINGAFGTLAPVFGSRNGLSTWLIAVLMGVAIVCGALSQVPIGRISDRTDRRYIVAATAVGSGLAGLAIFAFGLDTGLALMIAIGIYGALNYPIYALAVAHANDHADTSSFVAVSGGLLLLYGAGTMFGPIAASMVMMSIKPGALFLVTALSHFLIAGYAIYRTYQRAPIPEGAREAFLTVPSPRALTPEGLTLDPRSEELPGGDERPAGDAAGGTAEAPADGAEATETRVQET